MHDFIQQKGLYLTILQFGLQCLNEGRDINVHSIMLDLGKFKDKGT